MAGMWGAGRWGVHGNCRGRQDTDGAKLRRGTKSLKL